MVAGRVGWLVGWLLLVGCGLSGDVGYVGVWECMHAGMFRLMGFVYSVKLVLTTWVKR